MALNVGILNTGENKTTKLDLTTPLNMYNSMRANKRAQSLADLTLDNAEKKAIKEADIKSIMQSSLNDNGQVDGKRAIQGLNEGGFFEEANTIKVRMDKAQKSQQEAQEKKRKRDLGIVASVGEKFLELPSEQQLDQWSQFGNYLEGQGIDVSQWDATQPTPQALQQIEGAIAQANEESRNKLSFEQKKDLIDYRYNQKGNFEQLKSDVKTGAGLTKAQKLSRDLDLKKFKILAKKLGIAETQLGIDEDELTLKTEKQKADIELAKAKEARDVEAFKQKKLKNARANRAYKKKNSGQIDSLQNFIDRAESVEANENMKYVTGLGQLGRFAPGSGAADLQADIDFLISSGVIETMTKLKSESPTGSTGFGALSQKELQVMERAFSLLGETNISPKKKRAEVNSVLKIMRKRLKEQRAIASETEEFLGPEKTEDELINDAIDGL